MSHGAFCLCACLCTLVSHSVGCCKSLQQVRGWISRQRVLIHTWSVLVGDSHDSLNIFSRKQLFLIWSNLVYVTDYFRKLVVSIHVFRKYILEVLVCIQISPNKSSLMLSVPYSLQQNQMGKFYVCVFVCVCTSWCNHINMICEGENVKFSLAFSSLFILCLPAKTVACTPSV